MRLSLLLLCGLLACGGHPAKLSDMKRPWYALTSGGLDTSVTIALDGDGNVWRESILAAAKNQGFSHVGTAPAVQRDSVARSFAALPAVQDPSCVGRSHESLTQGAKDGSTRTWIVCTDADDRRLAPYGDAVSSMNSLPVN